MKSIQIFRDTIHMLQQKLVIYGLFLRIHGSFIVHAVMVVYMNVDSTGLVEVPTQRTRALQWSRSVSRIFGSQNQGHFKVRPKKNPPPARAMLHLSTFISNRASCWYCASVSPKISLSIFDQSCGQEVLSGINKSRVCPYNRPGTSNGTVRYSHERPGQKNSVPNLGKEQRSIIIQYLP